MGSAYETAPKHDLTDDVVVALVRLWSWRVEALMLTAATGLFVVAGRYGLAVIGIIVLLTRSGLVELLRQARVRRAWQRAVVTSGAAALPTKRSRKAASLIGPRVLRITRTPTGDTLIVKVGRGRGTVDSLTEHADGLAADLDSRLDPVMAVRVRPLPNASRAEVTIVRRDPFRDAPPIDWPLASADRTDVWTPFPFGVYEDGTTVELATMGGHVLIGGVTGSGKSVALNLFVAHAALDPSAHLYLVDGKHIELEPWVASADRFAGSDIADAVAVLERAVAVMGERYGVLRAQGGRKFGPGDETHHVIIDELPHYLLHADRQRADRFRGLMLELLQKGRAAGFRVIAVAQRPSAEIMDTNLRAQFSYRIAFRVLERETTQMILGRTDGCEAHAIPKGYAGVGYIGGESDHPRRMRSYYLDDADVTAIADRATSARIGAELAVTVPDDPGPRLPEPIDYDRFTHVVDTGDTFPAEWTSPTVPEQAASQGDSTATPSSDDSLRHLPSAGDGLTRDQYAEAAGVSPKVARTRLEHWVATGRVRRDPPPPAQAARGRPFRYWRAEAPQ